MKYARILIVFVVLFSSVFAAGIVVASDKQKYGPGETAKITVVLSNDKSTPENVLVQFHIILPDESTTLGQMEQITLGASSSKTLFFNHTVSLSDLPGTYTAAVSYSTSDSYSEKTATFEVINTEPPISFSLSNCGTSTCSDTKTTFLTGETAYIKLRSEATDALIEATLKTPDGATQQMSFNGGVANITTTKTGIYEVTVTLSKSNYTASTQTLQFAAVGEDVQIASGSKCNANGACDAGETSQNCPQDCAAVASDFLKYLQWAVIAVLIVLAVFFALRGRKQKITASPALPEKGAKESNTEERRSPWVS